MMRAKTNMNDNDGDGSCYGTDKNEVDMNVKDDDVDEDDHMDDVEL